MQVNVCHFVLWTLNHCPKTVSLFIFIVLKSDFSTLDQVGCLFLKPKLKFTCSPFIIFRNRSTHQNVGRDNRTFFDLTNLAKLYRSLKSTNKQHHLYLTLRTKITRLCIYLYLQLRYLPIYIRTTLCIVQVYLYVVPEVIQRWRTALVLTIFVFLRSFPSSSPKVTT